MTNLRIVPPALTKKAIADAGKQYTEAILNAGEADPLVAYIHLRALKGAIDSALLNLEISAMGEADKFSRDDRVVQGVKFYTTGGGEQWDYTRDAEWNNLKDAEMAAADARKKREAFLKTLEKKLVDPDTAEVSTPGFVKGYTKTSLALTFPKE